MKKFYKFTNNSFRMVRTWKTGNIPALLPLKDKNGYKSYVIYKGDCSWVHVTMAKPNVMRKLDRMNIIIQLKVQNH